MASRKIYTPYKRIIEELGLFQLDVYRVRTEKGTLKDVLRIQDPASGKVVTIDLGATREALSLTEYLDKVVEALTSSGVALPERRIRQLRERLERMEKARAAAT